MAGDWIKVEKSTSLKPEVLQLSEILEIHPAHAFGLCMKFWIWCDDHLTNSNARSVTKVTLDYIIQHQGFTGALISVGWLQSSEGTDGPFKIPNFERHLSEGAKTRALGKERIATLRKNNNATAVTEVTQPPLLEKRREEYSTPKVPKGTVPRKSPEADQILNRAKALLKIRSSTLLDSGQSAAWKKNKAAVASTAPEDWDALEWWFTQPSGTGENAEYRRTTLGALLNHWSDEVVKACASARALKVRFGADKKERAPEIPDDWRGILTELDPEFNAPDHFEQLAESVRTLVLEVSRKKKKEAGADDASAENSQPLL